MNFLQVKSEKTFKKLSLELFDFHYNENDNYREFCDNIKLNNGEVDSIEKIPFLPIILFKNKKISVRKIDHQKIFESS